MLLIAWKILLFLHSVLGSSMMVRVRIAKLEGEVQ
jgi:hypothetical protein